MTKTIGTNKTVTDSSDRKTSMEIMRKKKKQVMGLSDEENNEEKVEEKSTNSNMEDDLKVKKIKNEVQNIDRFFTGSGNCRSQFLPMNYWKKEKEMLLRLLKNFGMKDVEAVVDAFHMMMT